MKSDCPLCGDPSACKGYPLMWRRLREGRDVEHWRRLHARYNGQAVEPATYPSLAAQAANFGKAMARAARNRFKRVSSEEQARRLSICRGCEHFVPDAVRCVICGCKLPLKTRLESEHCPINKW